MNTKNLKKLAMTTGLGLFIATGGSVIANAQTARETRQQQKLERQREKLQAQRQANWNRRNQQIVVRPRTGSGYYTVEPNTTFTAGRYRVVRNGRFYNTDHRGAELLRNAVNEGYRQGFAAGRSHLNSNRQMTWSDTNVYRSGVYGYQNGVDRGQYQYYFREGFKRGYQDGTNYEYNRENYNGQYQYGEYNNGQPSILGAILNQILNLQSY
jgi:hypothetical protein